MIWDGAFGDTKYHRVFVQRIYQGAGVWKALRSDVGQCFQPLKTCIGNVNLEASWAVTDTLLY